MSARRQRWRRGRGRGLAPVCLLALLLLWQLRPELPPWPPSLPSPLTLETLTGLAVSLLWLVLGLLALALLLDTVRMRPDRPSTNSEPSMRFAQKPAARTSARAARTSMPRLVISPPRPPTPAQAEAGTSRTAEADVEGGAHGTPAPSRPRVSLLGPLTVTGAKVSRRGLRASALELVAYLALHRRRVQRDELLEAFWPGEDPNRTRLRLHQAVRDARRLLGSAISNDHNGYWLERTQIDVDTDELGHLLAEAQATEQAAAQQLLEAALALFGGEPLAGSDYAWAEGKLRSLRADYVGLLERVGRARLERGAPRAALEAAEQALAVDSLNENLWRLALEAEAALGLREAIIERYERLCQLLDERLGLEPQRRTRALQLELLGQS